jgi:hypothetical protein
MERFQKLIHLQKLNKLKDNHKPKPKMNKPLLKKKLKKGHKLLNKLQNKPKVKVKAIVNL